MRPINHVENRTISLNIRGYSDTCLLAANYDEVKRKYYMPGLEIKTRDGKIDEYWDNGDYLFGELYTNLTNYIFTDSDLGISTYLMDNRDELLSLLEKGIDLGWNKL